MNSLTKSLAAEEWKGVLVPQVVRLTSYGLQVNRFEVTERGQEERVDSEDPNLRQLFPFAAANISSVLLLR